MRRFPAAGVLKLPILIGSRTLYVPDNRQLRADVDACERELRAFPKCELAKLYAAEWNKEVDQRRLKAEAGERALHFNQPYLAAFEKHALALGIRPQMAGIHNERDIEREIARFAEQPNGGLVVLPDATSGVHQHHTSLQKAA